VSRGNSAQAKVETKENSDGKKKKKHDFQVSHVENKQFLNFIFLYIIVRSRFHVELKSSKSSPNTSMSCVFVEQTYLNSVEN